MGFIQCFADFFAPLGEQALHILDVVFGAEFPVLITADDSFAFDENQNFEGGGFTELG